MMIELEHNVGLRLGYSSFLHNVNWNIYIKCPYPAPSELAITITEQELATQHNS